MKISKLAASFLTIGVVVAIGTIIYKYLKGAKPHESGNIFDHSEDEMERQEAIKKQSNDRHNTNMLSEFGTDRMNDDAAVNLKTQLPNRGNLSDFEISSSTHR